MKHFGLALLLAVLIGLVSTRSSFSRARQEDSLDTGVTYITPPPTLLQAGMVLVYDQLFWDGQIWHLDTTTWERTPYLNLQQDGYMRTSETFDRADQAMFFVRQNLTSPSEPSNPLFELMRVDLRTGELTSVLQTYRWIDLFPYPAPGRRLLLDYQNEGNDCVFDLSTLDCGPVNPDFARLSRLVRWMNDDGLVLTNSSLYRVGQSGEPETLITGKWYDINGAAYISGSGEIIAIGHLAPSTGLIQPTADVFAINPATSVVRPMSYDAINGTPMSVDVVNGRQLQYYGYGYYVLADLVAGGRTIELHSHNWYPIEAFWVPDVNVILATFILDGNPRQIVKIDPQIGSIDVLYESERPIALAVIK